MRLGVKATLLLAAGYALLMVAFALGVDRWLRSFEEATTGETVRLLAREQAAILSERTYEALLVADGASRARLRERVEDVVLMSEVRVVHDGRGRTGEGGGQRPLALRTRVLDAGGPVPVIARHSRRAADRPAVLRRRRLRRVPAVRGGRTRDRIRAHGLPQRPRGRPLRERAPAAAGAGAAGALGSGAAGAAAAGADVPARGDAHARAGRHGAEPGAACAASGRRVRARPGRGHAGRGAS